MKPFVMFKVVDKGANLYPDGFTVSMHHPEEDSFDEEGAIESAQTDYNMIASHVDGQLDEIVKYIGRLEEKLDIHDSHASPNIYRFRENCKTLGAYWQRNSKLVRPDL